MGSGFESRGVHQRVPLDLLKGKIGRDFFVPGPGQLPRKCHGNPKGFEEGPNTPGCREEAGPQSPLTESPTNT